MNRVGTTLTLLTVLSLSSVESLAQAPVPQIVTDSTRYLFGQWVADVELAGQTRHVHMSVEPMAGEASYVIHWSGPGGPGKPDTKATVVGGWDAANEVYREVGFAANGSLFDFTYKQQSPKSFAGIGTGVYLGKKLSEEIRVNRKSRDEFTWTASNIKVGEDKLPDEVYHFRRVSLGTITKAPANVKKWWRFLKGEWDYKIPDLNREGTVTWRTAAKGNAMVGRFEDNEVSSIEVSGYDPVKKVSVINGYGSSGNLWRIELTKFEDDRIEGPHYGVLPDGTTIRGTFVGSRVGDDQYNWTFKGESADGEEVKLHGEMSRKQP